MNLCIVNEDHPQCNVPRKATKACQGKGRGALPLRDWPCWPFFSTGFGSLCEFVSSQPQCYGHCRPVSETGWGSWYGPGTPLCCNRSRPGGSTFASSRWKKMHIAMGMFDMPLFPGGVIHACCKPRVEPQKVPSPVYAKCTQSWLGANIDYHWLYNRPWFCACGPLSTVTETLLSLSSPDIWVRDPDWLHFPYIQIQAKVYLDSK